MNTDFRERDFFADTIADRMLNVPRSFIREILKVATEPNMTSFAGGLPNRDLFPVHELKDACDKVFTLYGSDVLQYSNSEGLGALREMIAAHYASRGIRNVLPENILITCGSQQALDLLGKLLINKGDRVVIEEPSYLGAIQALSIYEPQFVSIPLADDGMDVDLLKRALLDRVKMMYIVPNFHNPTGISYSEDNRRAMAEVLRGTKTFVVEDDPYGQLRFSGQEKTSFYNLIPENTILLGSFSKTVVPAFRLGWAVVPPVLMEKLLVAKQATDLHTNSFSQRVICQYMMDNDPAAHIAKIVARYATQKTAMKNALVQYFPVDATHTDPEGGMFIWAKLPREILAMRLFEAGVKEHVCIVPGDPFYYGKTDVPTLRLSFSCADLETIDRGMRILGRVAHEVCA